MSLGRPLLAPPAGGRGWVVIMAQPAVLVRMCPPLLGNAGLPGRRESLSAAGPLTASKAAVTSGVREHGSDSLTGELVNFQDGRAWKERPGSAEFPTEALGSASGQRIRGARVKRACSGPTLAGPTPPVRIRSVASGPREAGNWEHQHRRGGQRDQESAHLTNTHLPADGRVWEVSWAGEKQQGQGRSNRPPRAHILVGEARRDTSREPT